MRTAVLSSACTALRGFLLTASVFLSVPLHAQTLAAAAPAFDVVSIRPHNSGTNAVEMDVENDTYSAVNVSLKMLLHQAYGIREDLISGIPRDMESARFDIKAKVLASDHQPGAMLNYRPMVVSFLRQRFHLQTHTELRTLPLYQLVVFKRQPKVEPFTGDVNSESGFNGDGRTAVAARNVPMDRVASYLADIVHRTVVNKTGLKGRYSFSLNWSPEDTRAAEPDAGPSIFTAVREQLGLSLKAAKGPVQVLVVDHVEQPTQN